METTRMEVLLNQLEAVASDIRYMSNSVRAHALANPYDDSFKSIQIESIIEELRNQYLLLKKLRDEL